jgi:hypothetical protein
MKARGTLGMRLQKLSVHQKNPRLFQNGKRRNLPVLAIYQTDQKTYLTNSFCAASAAVRIET